MILFLIFSLLLNLGFLFMVSGHPLQFSINVIILNLLTADAKKVCIEIIFNFCLLSLWKPYCHCQLSQAMSSVIENPSAQSPKIHSKCSNFAHLRCEECSHSCSRNCWLTSTSCWPPCTATSTTSMATISQPASKGTHSSLKRPAAASREPNQPAAHSLN